MEAKIKGAPTGRNILNQEMNEQALEHKLWHCEVNTK